MSTPPILVPCPQCGTEMPDGAELCPKCDAELRAASQPVTRDIRERAAAVACYLTPVPAILFLKLGNYRRSAFIRFHAWQSILLGIAVLALVLLGALLANILWTVLWMMFGVLFVVALFLLWLVLSIKAAMGIKFSLPILGALAEARARAS